MTLSFSWATNANFSTGPDAGTPTKVDPASTANGFVNGTIAAAQHINFLFNGLSTELVKAIDGVNGGTYTLGSVLRFEGADVQIAADLEVVNGGEINVQAGGLINITGDIQVKSSGDINVESGGDINVESGGDIHLVSGAGLELDPGAVFLLEGTQNVTGQINLLSGADLDLASGSTLTNGGAITTSTGATLTVDSGGFLTINGLQTVNGSIDVNAGGSITIEDQNDLLINSDAVNVRLCMTPTWIETATGLTWDRTAASPGGALIQTQVDATAQYIAMFPLALPPGDDITAVTVMLHGTIGSAGSHADLPGLMPQVALISVDAAGTQTTISAAAAPNDGVDASASQAAYDANHTVIWAPASTLTVSGSNAYYVLVLGEAGSDSQANSLGIRSITVSAVARSFRGTGSSNAHI
jgi:hypothetical protein